MTNERLENNLSKINEARALYLVHIPLSVLAGYNIILFLLALAVISAMLYTFDVALRQRIAKAYLRIASSFLRVRRKSGEIEEHTVTDQ